MIYVDTSDLGEILLVKSQQLGRPKETRSRVGFKWINHKWNRQQRVTHMVLQHHLRNN